MKISDEIRQWCDICCDEYINADDCDELRELASRIDRELVELPKDCDGVPISVGDTVYSPDGEECCVEEITILTQGVYVKCKAPNVTISTFFSHDLTHERPDSFERIADDIEVAEGWCDREGGYGTGITSVKKSTLREWAERIRKLAEKEEDECGARVVSE